MKNSYELDELINDLFLETKEKYKFMNLNDIDLLKVIGNLSEKIKNISVAKKQLIDMIDEYYFNIIRLEVI